jgi:hypothetical protein
MHTKRPAHRCRLCPYCGPWGECLDRRLKSGRCGDWIWYLRGRKQCRRLYAKPQNPRTPGQRYWRRQFGAASKRYSHSLRQEQQDVCIAAGAKLRSRSRLGQSGPLTGQQYSVQRDCAAKATQEALDAKSAMKALQTKGILPSTPDTRRDITGPPPGHHRVTPGHAGGDGGRKATGKGRRQPAVAVSGLRRRRRITLATWPRRRGATWALRRHAAANRGIFPVSRRARMIRSAAHR